MPTTANSQSANDVSIGAPFRKYAGGRFNPGIRKRTPHPAVMGNRPPFPVFWDFDLPRFSDRIPFLTMPRFVRLATLFTSLLLVGFTASAQNDAVVPTGPMADFQAIDERIRAKIEVKNDDFAAEAEDFAKLIEKYREEKTEDVARLHIMHAMFLLQIQGNLPAALAQLKSTAADFPATETGAYAGSLVSQFNRKLEQRNQSARLTGQPAPELNFNWSTDNTLARLSDLRGKVVVLDFWATWCGPCVATFPQIRELQDHYADADVEIVGVTSLQGRVHGLQPARINTQGDPDREYALTGDFIAAKEMTWTIAFSEEHVFNPDYGVTGIPHMVIIAPDGTIRHPSLHPAMPHAEKLAMIDEILTEFDLTVPAHEQTVVSDRDSDQSRQPAR